jgi:uncharacterized protein YjiS (DUF1127 family)
MYPESLSCRQVAAPVGTLAPAWTLWEVACQRYAIWRARRLDRAAFKSLLLLDDHLLEDLGCTREEIRWAAALPLSVNAALALEGRSRARRREAFLRRRSASR